MSLLLSRSQRAIRVQLRGDPTVNGDSDLGAGLPKSKYLQEERQDHKGRSVPDHDAVHAESEASLRGFPAIHQEDTQEEYAKGPQFSQDQHCLWKSQPSSMNFFHPVVVLTLAPDRAIYRISIPIARSEGHHRSTSRQWPTTTNPGRSQEQGNGERGENGYLYFNSVLDSPTYTANSCSLPFGCRYGHALRYISDHGMLSNQFGNSISD